MYFVNLAGPIALVMMTAIMFLLGPWERIQRYFLVATAFGVALGAATYYILQNLVQAWRSRTPT